MPIDLTSPITVTSERPASAGRLKIVEFTVDNEDKQVQVILSREDGGGLQRIPGALMIENISADTTRQYAGQDFSVVAGNYFDDMAAAAPSGSTAYDVTKNSLYAMLGTMYGLTGTVS